MSFIYILYSTLQFTEYLTIQDTYVLFIQSFELICTGTVAEI